jgi:MoaA/NifB/PqqE/SkfB family radical SAM enzyme
LRAVTAANTFLRVIRLCGYNRSPLAWSRHLHYLTLRLRRRPVPKFMTMAVTSRCQCRCPHCYSNASLDRRPGELGTDELKSVIDQARDLGVLEIIFSGGEPLLRSDIFELVRHAHERGLLTRLNSNGLLLDRGRIKKLKDAKLTRCAVSIDDPDPTVHDRLRGVPGLFRKAVAGVESLVEAGLPCQIQTCASRRLIGSGLKEIIALGKRLGVMGVFILFPMAVGRWDGAFAETLTEAERAEVRKLQDLTRVHLEVPTAGSLCSLFTRSIFYVSPQGDVSACPFMPFRMGNIKEHALQDIWRLHNADLGFELRGDCPLNVPRYRESLEKHFAARASALREAP